MARCFPVVVIILLLVSTCVAAKEKKSNGPPALSTVVRQVLYEAQEKYRAGDRGEAEEILTEFVEENPGADHYLIPFMLGTLSAEGGRTREAIRHFTRSSVLYPDHPATWFNLGKLQVEQGSYLRAGDALAQGYERSAAKDHGVIYQAAVCYLLGKDSQKGIALLETLVALPTPEVRWGETLVEAYLDNASVASAQELVDQMSRRTPNQPEVWKLRARVMLEAKAYEAALQALLIYSYQRELTPQEELLVGKLYSLSGVPSQAARHYLAARERSREPLDAAQAQQIALTYLAAQETEEALTFLEEAVAQTPSAELWLLLGKILYDKGGFVDAAQALEESAKLSPLDGQVYLILAYCRVKLGDTQGAMAALTQARAFPEQSEAAEGLREQLKTVDTFARQ